MATYFPEKYWTREKVSEHLDRLVETLGAQTIIDNINCQFDIDGAAWFVEQLEHDYEIEDEFDEEDEEDEEDEDEEK